MRWEIRHGESEPEQAEEVSTQRGTSVGYENPNGEHPWRGPPGTDCQSQSRQRASTRKGDSGNNQRLVTYKETDQISKYSKENMVEGGYKYGNGDINREREKTNMTVGLVGIGGTGVKSWFSMKIHK